MDRPKRRISLRIKLLGGVLFSLLLACLVFLASLYLSESLIEHTVGGDTVTRRIASEKASDLQVFILEREVTKEEIERLNGYARQEKDLFLNVYLGDSLIYTSEQAYRDSVDPYDFDPDDEIPESEYPLTLSDETPVRAFIYYRPGNAYLIRGIFCSAAAFATFVLCLLYLVNKKLQYIKRLENELNILAGGDMEYPITVLGNDELEELAFGIDEMRRSILSHQNVEQQIRSANVELVTAMAHDLRTPMTSLLAFLELLDREKYQNEEQRQYLVHQSLEQTLTVKSLSDKLFEYFLDNTTEWEAEAMVPTDAGTWLADIWEEYGQALENEGFRLDVDRQDVRGTILADTALLRRAFGNLYQNIHRYADPVRPLSVRVTADDDHLTVSMENAIAESPDHAGSAHIGLNTCRRIFSFHNGTFEAGESADGLFRVTITLPFMGHSERSSG